MTGMTRRKRLLAVLLAGVLAVAMAACGSDDDSGTSAGGSGSGSESGSAGGELQIDDPVKLVLLAEIAGESSYGVDDFRNGAELAVEQINEAGGIGGQEIELDRIPASPVDPQDTNTAFLQALDEDPTAVFGLPAAGAQLNGIVSQVERGGVPVVVTGVGDDTSRFGNEGGSTYAWFAEPNTGAIAEIATRYLIDELGAENIGLLATNEAHGAASMDGAAAALEDAGLEPVAERTYDPGATDLTEAVTAVQDADAVADFGYPNPVAIQLREFARNGIDIPTMATGTGGIIVSGGLAEGRELANLYDAVSCNPLAGGDDRGLNAFVDAYQSTWDTAPTTKAAVAYDTVYVLKAAIEQAGSAEGEDVNDALGSVEVTDDVVCSPEYRADGSHFLNHSVSIVDFAEDGSAQTVDTYDVDPLDEAG
jgi:branched-chain amino acid transport system substrate-binding protein